MSKNLIIVESPAKVKTISKFLSKDFDVVSSYGHIRALPRKDGSVDIEHDFAPNYQILPEKKKVIDQIKRHLKGVETLYLATDMDREGEAIAWHLSEVLNVKKKNIELKRITFNEITKRAVTEALKSPRDIALDLVYAQKARVVLDYLVGFNLSPFLWKKVRYGLSAGRVQSVALRLICEREEEINAFNVEEYWTVTSELFPKSAKKDTFEANLTKIDGKKLDKLFIKDKKQADSLLKEIEKCPFTVISVTHRNVKRHPAAPFITSTLQQDASRKLHFGAKKTMMTAQRLYEGVDVAGEHVGLITYMRTDSVRLSDEALSSIRGVIKKNYGDKYAFDGVRAFKSKVKNAQEAHEAIRPTDATRTPQSIKKYLKKDEFRLYELIWKRTIASQMASAEFKNVAADISAGEKFTFHATGSTMLFDGFLKVYIEGKEDNGGASELTLLPELKKGQELDLKELVPTQHFTQPPPRFSEATLVKTLEEHGIGRPSTYANIINTLIVRKYVHLDNRRFIPDDVGMIVSKLLSDHFKMYVDYEFTANLEEELDSIAHGKKKWIPFIKKFWKPFIAKLNEKHASIKKSDITSEDTDKDCPECKAKLKIKLGKTGKFYGCSNFPECRYTAPLNDSDPQEKVNEVTDEKCPKCGKPMVIKVGRFGKFLGCSGYPDCKSIQPLHKPEKTGVKCPGCGKGELTKKMSRRFNKAFYSCDRYPKCKYIVNNKPIPGKCPKCKAEFLIERTTKAKGTFLACNTKDCDYTKIPDEK
jgi:DNA topoisomerase-1